MKSRLIIDSLFSGREFTFEADTTVGGVEDVPVIVTYEGTRHSDEDRKLTGQVGEVKVTSVRLKGETMSGPDKVEVLDTVDIEDVEDKALEHFRDHHADNDEGQDDDLSDILDP